MTTRSPFLDDPLGDHDEAARVGMAQAGDQEALESLVRRHSPWIYNIALRMLCPPDDAQDASQEILVKVITRLSTFEGRSSFRTWLYRIAVNHLLTMERLRRERWTFEAYGRVLDELPEAELVDSAASAADTQVWLEEARIGCTTGLLLCLDREQRLIYILGDIFGVSDRVGAELLDLSRDNFRQRLSRARRDLQNFAQGKCHRAHPFQTPPDFVARLRSLLAVVLVIVTVGACRAAPASSTDILALERAAAERWGQGDPDGYLELMAPDITYFDSVSGKRFDGFDAVKGLIEPVRGRLHYDSIEFIAPSVRRYGDTAVLTYSLLTHGVRFDGSPAAEGAWNTTNVYRYANGEWRIVHSHFARRTATPGVPKVPKVPD